MVNVNYLPFEFCYEEDGIHGEMTRVFDIFQISRFKDNLRREGFGLPNRSKLKKEEVIFCGNKITFSEKDP